MRIQSDDDMHRPAARDSPSNNGGRLLLGIPSYARFWPNSPIDQRRLNGRSRSRTRNANGSVQYTVDMAPSPFDRIPPSRLS